MSSGITVFKIFIWKGVYVVGYTVGNIVLRRRASGAVKRQFGPGLCFYAEFGVTVRSSEKGPNRTLVRSLGSEKGERIWPNPGLAGSELGERNGSEPWFGRFGVRRKEWAEPWFGRF